MAGINPTSREVATWGNPQETSGVSPTSDASLLRRYRDRITAATRWREDEKYDKTWKRLRDIYRLKPFQTWSDDDRIAVSIAFSTINVIGPSVAVNYPKIAVKSRSEDPDSQNKAVMIEAITNYWWRHFDFRDENRRVVQDFLVYGHGWGKVGWRFREELRKLTDDEKADVSLEQTQQIDSFSSEYPDLVNDLPQPQDIADSQSDFVSEVLEDVPFFERISPFDVYVDPEATSMKDAQWIAQRIVMPLDTAKKDERFTKSARRKLKADGSLKWFNEDNKSNVPDDHGRVTVWEFYDLIRGEMSIFADQQKDVGFLVKPIEFPYPYGHPFVMLRNYEVPDQFYTIGEIEAIEPLQNELNHTRSAMVLARKLDIPKYLIRKDALDTDGIDALTSNNTNALVPVRDDTPFPDVIAPVPRNNADAMFYNQHSQVIEDDIDRVTGVNEYMRGALPEVRRTATEASIIQDAANARAADKLARVEDFIAEVSQRLVQLAQVFLTTEQVARITTEQGAQVWVPYNREDVEGEFDFEVEGGSTQPQNETFRRQQAVALMNTMAPFVGQVIDPAALATHVLREGFGIKNPERFIVAAPPVMPPDAAGAVPAGPDGAIPPAPSAASDAGAGAVPPAPSDQMAGQMSALQAGAVPPPEGMPI
jgi:hypothetical protein